MDWWGMRLVRLPRALRMVACVVVAVLSAWVFSQTMLLLAGQAIVADSLLTNLSFLIAVVGGTAVYGVGWWSLVGFTRERYGPGRRRAAFFMIFGVVVFLVSLVWLVVILINIGIAS